MKKKTFWEQREEANHLVRKLKYLRETLNKFKALEQAIQELKELSELADEGEVKEIALELQKLWLEIETLEKRHIFQEENDFRDAIVEIHPGAGGTESCDWAEMLLRMYLRWAEQKNFKSQIIDLLPGEEAGIKRVTLIVRGENAFGYLKAEAGVHRLVRISPFDAARRRHTSFASVFVYPEIGDEIKVDIQPKDLRIDVYRASSAGGQHVNTTDSAVRITHLPTGIVVQCQNERSQHQNKAFALKILKARLYEYYKKEKENQQKALHQQKRSISWGNQIRSYILYPYRLIKDHRTGYETSKVNEVLDGELDKFIEAFLKKK
jgi:peptide chain release factor 2